LRQEAKQSAEDKRREVEQGGDARGSEKLVKRRHLLRGVALTEQAERRKMVAT
jgi:hypothetical protein